MKTIFLLLSLLIVSGCVSSLECGVDGNESYVVLVNVKDGTTVRNYSELCGFVYDVEG